MFWGLVLEPSKKYTQKVDQTFHISQAALDLKSSDQEPIQLLVEYESSTFVLATLSKKANIFQVPLDLIFKTGDQVSFRTIGNGKVHLSGYHVLEDIDSMLMNGEEESDVDELEEIQEVKGKRKKLAAGRKANKKAKFDDSNENESDEDDDEESDDEDDDEIVSFGKNGQKKKKKLESSLVSMDDDDEDDEDDDDFDEEDDDDEDDDDDDDDDLEMDEDDDEDDEEEEDDVEDEKMQTPKSAAKKKNQTPNGISPEMKGKDKSNQKLNKSKNEMNKKGTPGKEGKTPKNDEKSSKVKTPGETPQRKGSEGMKNGEKTPKSPKGEGSPQKKVLEGGVIAEEIKVGDGPAAKPGKLANVYYVGTLQSTKKQFDSMQQGPGFKFRIGKNEVIKGWDIGINGMKVGGKRKLTIPPHLAYGSKGSPPVIPPNSTLVFTVELRGLS